jgi:hypothetical protein
VMREIEAMVADAARGPLLQPTKAR